MRHSSHVKVNLICEGCNGRTQACVLVDREVPTPLRCSPGGSLPTKASGSHRPPNLRCAECDREWSLSPDHLMEAVNHAIRRGGWGEFVRHDGVDVSCRLA